MAIAARGVTAGALAGWALLALGLWVVRGRLEGAPPSELPVTDAGIFWLLVSSLFAAVLLAATVTWRQLGRLPSHYRRGGLTVVAGMSVFLGGLLITLAYEAYGRPALLLIAGAGTLGSVLAARPWRPTRDTLHA